MAHAMKSTLRTVDLPARIGGDEFAVILPETSLDGARETMRRLLMALTEASALCGTVVTSSAGVVACPEHGSESADELMNHADLLMYKAKKAGKNRVEYAA